MFLESIIDTVTTHTHTQAEKKSNSNCFHFSLKFLPHFCQICMNVIMRDRAEPCRLHLLITDQFKRPLLGIVMAALQRDLT